MDEFWSFVGAKRRHRWICYGYDRHRRKVVAFVNERRTDAACRQLLQKLAGCRITRYHTDNWQSYAKFLPARRHRTGKEGTSRIERHNLYFRTRLKRLQRHTICYSKSAVMHDAVIKLFVYHSNAGHHHFLYTTRAIRLSAAKRKADRTMTDITSLEQTLLDNPVVGLCAI
jgi:insertion element IS1 protein InsB